MHLHISFQVYDMHIKCRGLINFVCTCMCFHRLHFWVHGALRRLLTYYPPTISKAYVCVWEMMHLHVARYLVVLLARLHPTAPPKAVWTIRFPSISSASRVHLHLALCDQIASRSAQEDTPSEVNGEWNAFSCQLSLCDFTSPEF